MWTLITLHDKQKHISYIYLSVPTTTLLSYAVTAVFLLVIVLCVLLRYTDSNYSFDIFKRFLPWHLKRREMRGSYHLDVHYSQNILRGLYNIDILVVKVIMIHLHQWTRQGLIRQNKHIPTPPLHHKKAALRNYQDVLQVSLSL